MYVCFHLLVFILKKVTLEILQKSLLLTIWKAAHFEVTKTNFLPLLSPSTSPSLSHFLSLSIVLSILILSQQIPFCSPPPPPRPRPSPKNSLIHKKLNNKIVMKICYISSLCIWTYCNNVSVSIFWCRIARFSGLLSYICSNMCKVEWENES